MTMPESYSDDWSPDAFMDAVALRINLQSMRRAAIRSNELHLAAIEAGHRLDPTRFVLRDLSHTMAPMDLQQIRRTPKGYDAEPMDGIYGVDLYFPDDAKYESPQGWWNDTFLEVWFDDGTSERLLFNSDGLTGYEMADDLQLSDIAAMTNNLYRTKPGRGFTPSIDFTVLETALYEYELAPLTSNEL